MELGKKEFDAMQSRSRKWMIRNFEYRLFKKFGMKLRCKEVLEIGCGSGYAASLITDAKPVRYVGVDIMQEQLDIAEQRNLENAVFIKRDASDLSCFEDASFDYVVIFAILHHVEGWKSTIKECNRILRDGGSIFVHEPSRWFIHIWDKLFKWGHAEEPLFTLAEFEQQAHRCGFVTVHKRNFFTAAGVYRFRKQAEE